MIYDQLFWRVILVGGLFAATAGALGCFVVWRRMVYFGDALAHSALLGIALGLIVGVSPQWGVLAVCLVFSIALTRMMSIQSLSVNTLLGIMAHLSLSLGVVLVALKSDATYNLHGYLFGDIVTVNNQDLILAAVVAILTGCLLTWNWSSLVLTAFNRDLARAERIDVVRIDFQLLLLTSLVVAVAIKILGVLLIISLLIIPPATARLFAHSPRAMVFLAALFGVLANLTGIVASSLYDLPTGPTIAISAGGLFLVLWPAARRRHTYL